MTPGPKRIFLRLLFIAGCIVLLVVAIFAVWRIRLAMDIHAQIAAIHAAGLPINCEEADKYYPAVPDEQNAAIKMADAFALLTNYPDERSNELYNITIPARTATLPPRQIQWLYGYCALNSNALQQAREAIQLPHCRYPFDLSHGMATLMPHVDQLGRLAQVAEYQSWIDPKHSTDEISTLVGLARTLEDEPLRVSKLVRLSILNTAATSLERRLTLAPMTETELANLEAMFAEAAKTNQLAIALIGERAVLSPYFSSDLKGIYRLAFTLQAGGYDFTDPPRPGTQSIFLKLSGICDQDLRLFLREMETNIAFASTFPKKVAVPSPVEESGSHDNVPLLHPLSSVFIAKVDEAITKDAMGLAQIRATQTVLAVERYRLAKGKLPTSLDDLMPQFLPAIPEDPFDGQPLRYQLLPRGYIVYSIGPDGQDDNGREKPAEVKADDKTTYDITFTVER